MREDSTTAALTADSSTTAGVPAAPVPVVVPRPDPPVPRSFPTNVAGFAFGQTIAELRTACATGHNGKSEARLTLDGSYAECPVQLTPLDFTKEATGFHVTGGKVVAIILTPTAYADGRVLIRTLAMIQGAREKILGYRQEFQPVAGMVSQCCAERSRP